MWSGTLLENAGFFLNAWNKLAEKSGVTVTSNWKGETLAVYQCESSLKGWADSFSGTKQREGGAQKLMLAL